MSLSLMIIYLALKQPPEPVGYKKCLRVTSLTELSGLCVLMLKQQSCELMGRVCIPFKAERGGGREVW